MWPRLCVGILLLSSTSSPCLLSMTFSHVSTKHSLDSGHSWSFGNLVVSSNLCLSQARQFVVVLLLISLSVLMVYSIISSDCPFTACLYMEYIISEEIGLNLLSPILLFCAWCCSWDMLLHLPGVVETAAWKQHVRAGLRPETSVRH